MRLEGFHLVGERRAPGAQCATSPGGGLHAMASIVCAGPQAAACPRPTFSSCAVQAPLLVAKSYAAAENFGWAGCSCGQAKDWVLSFVPGSRGNSSEAWIRRHLPACIHSIFALNIDEHVQLEQLFSGDTISWSDPEAKVLMTSLSFHSSSILQ